jgi:hypothetical protein
MFRPGDVVELRKPGAGKDGTHRLLQRSLAACESSGASNGADSVYLTLNPVVPSWRTRGGSPGAGVSGMVFWDNLLWLHYIAGVRIPGSLRTFVITNYPSIAFTISFQFSNYWILGSRRSECAHFPFPTEPHPLICRHGLRGS